jgi:DNA-binding MarR family transcriptional regulator
VAAESAEGIVRSADDVAAVRAFSRFYTRWVGALDQGFLRTRHSLPEARVLFELGRSERTEVASLRRALDLDPGYLSRLLAGLEAQGLVARERSRADARRQVGRLTRSGRAALRVLDRRSAEHVGAALDGVENGLPEDLISIDLRAALDTLGEITGETAGEDLLDTIFRRFCIGK